jgi:uncharacterized paraquat-inducible protein A
MQFAMTCESCGEVDRILVENSGEIPRCPRCGQTYTAIAEADNKPFTGNSAIDDIVVSWLDRTPSASEPASAGEGICQSCGYAGMTRGQAICPACGALYRTPSPVVVPTVDCPNCGQAIELSANDRGKTTICPGCKYFLGCVNQTSQPNYRGLFVRR